MAFKDAPKVLVPVAVILALVLAAMTFLRSRTEQAIHYSGPPVDLVLGGNVPDFVLHRFEGEELNVSKLPGKVILINFWATWCEACVVEMPSIIKLRNQFKDRGLEVVAISVDENPSTVLKPSLEAMKIDFPVFVDVEQKLSELFRVSGIPLTLIIDKNRKVLLIQEGERDWHSSEMQAQVERWLAG